LIEKRKGRVGREERKGGKEIETTKQ